ncbi:hypothetical protein E6W39_18995 [Kitasatospora acidiphila]|uniref:Uncharacterized protein n=1 Tax=Kitasatospora acidiphila TaxID=2567942 RepID=A0A540W4H6_9ACTN|nr:hypothetical protein [Kitasatospora acidiphila]TQF03939.1 hypothetical protein E6W39_18995 [Kitasatospora acidiphila]
MSANTPKSGLTYPSLSDPPNVPQNMNTLATQLDGIVIPKYASASAMTAANGTPAAGDMCYRTDLKAYMTYDGSVWTQVSNTGWQTWTPTWSTSTGLHLPSYGNATVSASYLHAWRSCFFNIYIVFGSTTNFGSGATTSDNWHFSLPPGIAPGPNFSSGAVFPGSCWGGSDGARVPCHGWIDNTNNFILNVDGMRVDGAATGNGAMDSLTPFTWASGYILQFSGVFETTT